LEVEKLPIYLVISYYVRPGKATEYQKWLNSKEAQHIFDQLEKETGCKYLNTYWPILGLGDYDCEDWVVAPDFAALDRTRKSKAFDEWNLKTYDLTDQTRSIKTRILRTAREVKIVEPK
jgi:hypothetical protein